LLLHVRNQTPLANKHLQPSAAAARMRPPRLKCQRCQLD
jgi:hypothetical protein